MTISFQQDSVFILFFYARLFGVQGRQTIFVYWITLVTFHIVFILYLLLENISYLIYNFSLLFFPPSPAILKHRSVYCQNTRLAKHFKNATFVYAVYNIDSTTNSRFVLRTEKLLNVAFSAFFSRSSVHSIGFLAPVFDH